MKSLNSGGIRLLAVDLDDTLLRSDLSISYKTRSAIKHAENAGVTTVLASGRIPAAMDRFSKLLGLNKKPGYLICNNGSIILESNSGSVIHEAKIAPETALTVCDLSGAEGFPVQMYEEDVLYVSRQNEYSRYDQKLTGLRQVVVENFKTLIGDGCHKLIIPGDPMLLAPLESLIRTYLGDELSIFTSRPYLLEIMPLGTDKGTALEKIAGIMGISAAETLAVGDSMNDEAMIKWAGVGAAMSNADERIKKIADYVTKNTNDDDGVAEVIGKYILNRETN